MRILVVGNGGREHAIIWKLAQSKKVTEIFITPGNPGTALLGTNLGISSTKEIVNWLRKNKVNLVVICPDNYLADGLANKVKKLGIAVFGPTKQAAEIEWSKSFAKNLMIKEGIPTARFKTFKNLRSALQYVQKQSFPLVVKANGLALGKGVIISKTLKEAESALKEIIGNKIFGSAGNEVLIEEYLEGREISVHAFCDGETVIMFPSSQDHKRIFDGENGPNTGGMGVIAPVPGISEKFLREIKETIVLPTLSALKKRGRPFVGVLYPGIMLTKSGPKVIEFNARFGDPEAQSYMRILESDLFEIIQACVNGKLRDTKIKWSKKSAACVVISSKGYPGKVEKGKIITGLEKIKGRDVVIFHAGTKDSKKGLVTNGGRVLSVTATGYSLNQALKKAYKSIESISFSGMQYRKDIGKNKTFK